MFITTLDFLKNLDFAAFVSLFWFFILFDVPRYTLSIIGILIDFSIKAKVSNHQPIPLATPISIILAGHNESSALKKCISSLKEQTIKNIQIIVIDDGSTDNMSSIASALEHAGVIDKFIRCHVRGGKSAAVNLGLSHCKNEFIVVSDIDTSLDRDALEKLLEPFSDPTVGAVAGNLKVRNTFQSLLTRFQHLEYLRGISLGRKFTSNLDMLAIISGAFGAFRKTAIDTIGGWDVGPGEDADITEKLRRANWRIAFAENAWALTDVPDNLYSFTKQRLRWDRSIIRFRYRKFSSSYNPFNNNFHLKDVFANINILFFQVFLCFSFFIYMTWLFIYLEEQAFVIIILTNVFYIIEDFISFAIAAIIYPEAASPRLIPYILGASLFNNIVFRGIRAYAYLDELINKRSYDDDYVPSKVRTVTEKF